MIFPILLTLTLDPQILTKGQVRERAEINQFHSSERPHLLPEIFYERRIDFQTHLEGQENSVESIFRILPPIINALSEEVFDVDHEIFLPLNRPCKGIVSPPYDSGQSPVIERKKRVKTYVPDEHNVYALESVIFSSILKSFNSKIFIHQKRVENLTYHFPKIRQKISIPSKKYFNELQEIYPEFVPAYQSYLDGHRSCNRQCMQRFRSQMSEKERAAYSIRSKKYSEKYYEKRRVGKIRSDPLNV